MTCVSPPELADGELLTFIDDEADYRVAAHLERCPHCRVRAQQLARLQGRLTAQLYRLTCPPPMELGDYHLGLLAPDRAAALRQHLPQCPHCSREVEQLRNYLADLAPTLEPDVLAQLRERVRVLVARLVSGGPGSGLTPALAGVRGQAEGPSVYQADQVQVTIEVQTDPEQPDRKAILGLVSGIEVQGLKAHLWREEQPVAQVVVDDLGNFVISDLVPGDYELIVSGPTVEIHVQDLEI